jgi:hypothetical protein
MTVPRFDVTSKAGAHPKIKCRHDEVKNLIAVPVRAVDWSGALPAHSARERSRPGRNGRSIVNRLNELISLPGGWDGANAIPPTESAVLSVLEVLNEISLDDVPPPHISPSLDGGLLFEWHRDGFELEVWVSSSGDVDVTYEHGDSAWDGSWETCGEGARQVLYHLAESVQ